MSGDSREKVLKDFSVSEKTAERLDILVAELAKWQRIKNLVGPATLDQVWSRHVADSLQLAELAPQGTKTWLDLGSGAGFPGLVLAILGAEVDFHVTMVESNARKCAFLRHVTRLTGASATIYAERLEVIIPKMVGKTDVLTARALASLEQLLQWTKPLFDNRTSALFPKGRDVQTELMAAAKRWDISYEIIPSRIDAESSIVRISSIKPL
ncbi:16S rRNA (guanine(527)-N(7))-methyltransferase RsmG [Microvirga sp. W0021]|uniref:Ribosomal RNA small subunit methyltransferase G n=1 Tax=Hohaiivirga grylli TaxID=3133970 RepID=A0ABV0BGF4_9HYPH